ncbi:PREDICTED: leucine-rich PPR motif-containing protein, mitochondrial isoform X2 [Rhagoletis zephyria]|uniref:leucine-rich PPR motif-containing protein, mitochondrial isoform X2 n=1 Tax=Rhagoletis zephyria TaxID=28612 RepID=UPI0008115B52|nr:PREDICTED: leucine-rich PPR motif-containing protein, mitochondrial isoform X2 [Rhagoletis zephyria]
MFRLQKLQKMASILRTGKFLRYFAGFTRNFVVDSVRQSENGNSLLQTSSSVCTQFQHGFANASPKSDLNLDKQLRRLDQDVRRVGRISRRDIDEVLEEIRSQRSATSSQSLLVIRCCGNLVPEEMPEVRTALVQEIWKTLTTLNVPMDISHYNALLRVYLENEHSFSPTDFLAEIESKNIEPNRVTYQRLIARYCQQGDIDGATRILEFMRSKNLPVNENVFNSLILGHSQANDLESAKGILSVMKQANLEPSADTYTTLLCCYARHGDIDAILRTLDECEKAEIFLLDKDLMDIAYALSIHGHADKVDAVLTRLRISTGFNQDAVNVILRLVNKGYEDVGVKILRVMPRGTRPDGQLVDTGTFFIKQLVKVNRPVEKILGICKTLKDEGLNPKALLIATEAGLSNGVVSSALPLLHELKKSGWPIRQHYFWPLICSAESNQIINIIRHMQEEFALNPNSETLRDYVIPNLKEKNWEKIVTILRGAGISTANAAASASYAALTINQLKSTANIMESFRAYYSPQIFRQPLIHALSTTNDYASFIRVLRQLYESVQSRSAGSQRTEPEESSDFEIEAAVGASNQSFDVVGSVLNDVCTYFRRNRIEVLDNILSALVKEGLPISNTNASRISDRLNSEMTTKISENLAKISSGKLELIPLQNAEPRKRSLDSLTVEELERFIANIEAKGNLDKTLQVIAKLEAEKFTIPIGIWAQLIDLYAMENKTVEALELYAKIKARDNQFVLDNLKTVNIAKLLIVEERFEEALEFLDRNKKSELIAETEGSFSYTSTVWRLLNTIAEAGNAEKLQQLFDALVGGKYIYPTNVLLGPLIKVHLTNDNIPKAMEVFEQICEKYKCTPWKNDLACRLIQKEDAANLQKLTDLSTNIHGEVNSLYDLVFSFVECGRIRQARKILETPGLRTRPQRINYACERYKNEGMVEPLEGLVEATKDLNHIDRNKIYYNLLLSYCKSDDAEKALGLWTKMQEENIAPNDIFLIKLAELLKKKNLDVPFVVPKQRAAITLAPKRIKKIEPDNSAMSAFSQPQTNLSLLRKAINSGDIDAALSLKNQLQPNESASVTDLSHLIEHAVRAERLIDATNIVNEVLAENRYPIPKIFKFYLNKIAASGDVDTLTRIGDKLSDEEKKIVSFDNRFCHANIVAGKTDQYLRSLYDQIAAAKTAEVAAKLADQFPRGGALGILQQNPESLSLFEKIAEKFAEHKQLGPVNVLWMHLLSQGNEAASKSIWNKYLSNAPRLMFQRVLQTAREQKDEKLAQTVISQLRESKISEGAIGNAYSCLIDIHTTNNNLNKALETLKTAIKDICLENINRTALLRLKTALQEQNRDFPYEIPEKKALKESSTSSQSSDDDVTPKRPETRPITRPNK